MKNRKRYIDKLIQYRDNDFVKVITGVRRSGKSSFLALFKEYLIHQGVEEKQIIEINYEKYVFDDLKNGKALHTFIKDKVTNKERLYFLIDEVQELNEWAKVINSLRASFNVDIYVTGSNSRMFLGQHLTYLF